MENEDHRRMEGKPDGCLVQVCTERNVDGSYIFGVGWKGRTELKTFSCFESKADLVRGSLRKGKEW